MSPDALKQAVAEAALAHALPMLEPDSVIGIGTGSTANCFIDVLAGVADAFAAAVASSEASAARLREHGIAVIDLNEAPQIAVYVDGADEVAADRALTKGGGGALTREKIVAASSRQFVCIVDDSKRVHRLGAFPLPVEVLPMARALVQRRLARLGGDPRPREGFVTDNGNVILDVFGLDIDDPDRLEATINNVPGVVTNGIFAANRPHVVLVASEDGVEGLA